MLSHADNEEHRDEQERPAAAPPHAPPAGPRAQRLSPEEAHAVVALWQEERVEQTGLTDRPAVPDVAEGLDLSVAEVQRLLAEVRARREAESRLLAHEQELSQIRLAEEERKLAEIQRQRAELRRADAEAQRQESDHWRRQTAPPSTRRGKPRQAAPAETHLWTGDEPFWLESEEDKEYRVAYRARRGRVAARSGIVLALMFLVLVIITTLYNAQTSQPTPPHSVYDYNR